jgi:hypothetical protein
MAAMIGWQRLRQQAGDFALHLGHTLLHSPTPNPPAIAFQFVVRCSAVRHACAVSVGLCAPLVPITDAPKMPRSGTSWAKPQRFTTLVGAVVAHAGAAIGMRGRAHAAGRALLNRDGTGFQTVGSSLAPSIQCSTLTSRASAHLPSIAFGLWSLRLNRRFRSSHGRRPRGTPTASDRGRWRPRR